jgi:uncharacterized protein YhaN
MRLSTLELLAFGHFSGETLSFVNKVGAIDIVYGDNEAGKSTSRRGVSCFLFGIPVRTTDDFVHQKPTMRVGAKVVGPNGETLLLMRRKGAKSTLRDASDNVVDEEILQRMLGGLDRDLFEQMFALSRDALVSGGNDLLAGKGSLGEALFGASLGLAGINAILHTLEEEAATLFKRGGSVPALNASLREVEELRRTARELELRPTDFLGHQSALDSARTEREALDAELGRVKAALARLERDKQLLPLAVLRTELSGEIESLGSVVALSATARQERLDAIRDQERAESDIEIAQQRIDGLTFQLDLVRPNTALLARADEVRALHTEIGAHRKAALDLPGLRSQQRAALDKALSLLAQTHPERTLESVAELRLTVADRATITTLTEDFGRVDETTRNANHRLAETQAKLQRARKALKALPALDDVSSAVAALDSARRLGDIEAAVSEEETEYRAAEAQLRADLAALPLFQGAIEELEVLPVPVPTTVARFEDAYEQLTSRERDLVAAQTRLIGESAKCRERLQALELAGDVPSEPDLTSARARREQGWQFVRQTLETGLEVDASPFADEQLLPDAFEASVTAADDVADRLRREADRVAARAELQAALETCEHELGDVQTGIADLNAEREELDAEWLAVWGPTGVAPLPPAEMREWLELRKALVSESASQRDSRGELDGKIALVAQHCQALSRELARLGREADSSATLAELVALADGCLLYTF